MDDINFDLTSGDKPSTLLLRLLSQRDFDSVSDLALLVLDKFDKLDSVVWNMIVAWKSNREKNPVYFDKNLDVNILNEFIKAGYEVPFTKSQLEKEWNEFTKK